MVVSGFLVVCLCMCFVYGIAKRSKLPEEYTSNRDATSTMEVAFSILGTCIGGWMFFGVVAIGYEAGVVGLIIGISYCLGLVILGCLAPSIKGMLGPGSDVLDDFFYAGGAKNKTVFLVAGVNLLVFLAFLSSQFIAFGSFLKVFGGEISLQIAVWLGASIVIAYTAIGGFKVVLKTDKFQSIFVLAISVFMLIYLHGKVSWGEVGKLPPQMFTGLGYGSKFLVGVLVFFSLTFLVRSDLWQRIASAKDGATARRAFLISAPFMLLAYFIFTTIGIWARAMLGSEEVAAIVGVQWFKSGAGSGVLAAVVSMGIFLAVLSTADSYLNLGATTLSKAFMRRKWIEYEKSKDVTVGKRLLFWLRLLTLLVGILGVCMWFLIPDIVDLIVAAASGLLIFAPAVLGRIFTQKQRAGATFWSIFLGAVCVILFLCVAEDKKSAFVPGIGISLVVYVVGSVIEKYVEDKRHSREVESEI